MNNINIFNQVLFVSQVSNKKIILDFLNLCLETILHINETQKLLFITIEIRKRFFRCSGQSRVKNTLFLLWEINKNSFYCSLGMNIFNYNY